MYPIENRGQRRSVALLKRHEKLVLSFTVLLQRSEERIHIEECSSNRMNEHFDVVLCECDDCFDENTEILQIIDVDFIVTGKAENNTILQSIWRK